MRCRTVLQNLDAYRTTETSPEVNRRVGRHLADCRPCEDDLREVEQLALRASQMRIHAPGNVVGRVTEKTDNRYGAVGTSRGKAWISFNPKGITMILLREDEPARFEEQFLRRFGVPVRPGSVPERYSRLVERAASGSAFDPAPVDLSSLSSFEQDVLRLLPQIPRGEVRPYAWLAHRAGRPRAVRAVGNAMSRNPVPLLLPCHRVVPTQGGIGKYAFGSELKRDLLLSEGVAVDELEDFARQGHRYVGSATTHIFCYPTCRAARRIGSKNRVPFAGVREASADGYRPCRLCQPVDPAS